MGTGRMEAARTVMDKRLVRSYQLLEPGVEDVKGYRPLALGDAICSCGERTKAAKEPCVLCGGEMREHTCGSMARVLSILPRTTEVQEGLAADIPSSHKVLLCRSCAVWFVQPIDAALAYAEPQRVSQESVL